MTVNVISVNYRLKILDMILIIMSKISYKMITLTWYKSFKQNIIKINCNINFKIRRTNYGKSTFNTIKYSFIYDINCIFRIIFFSVSIRISRRRYISRCALLFAVEEINVMIC